MSPKTRTLIFLTALIVPLDQLTKYLVTRYVQPWDPIEVIPGFFRITHAVNDGAALGLAQGVHIGVFIALTLVALALIGSFFAKIDAHDRLSAFSLGLIVAGAIGNLIDRCLLWLRPDVRAGVVDFLQFDFGLFVFPDFNVADSAIVIGVGMLLLDVVTQEAEGASSETDG